MQAAQGGVAKFLNFFGTTGYHAILIVPIVTLVCPRKGTKWATYPRGMGLGTVVYLHGMGGARANWADPLRVDATCVAPDYADLLDGSRRVYASSRSRAPHDVDADELEAQRRGYLARQRGLADVVHGIGEAMPPGSSWPAMLPRPGRLADRLPLPQVLRTPVFGVDQVGRYLDDEARRAAVLDRVRTTLVRARPPIVLVAHSLGSVVALDLLDDLPCEISLLITLGSPLGHQAVADATAPSAFPYGRVGGWVNVVHLLDPVPFGRGLADRYPAAYDVYLPVLAGLGPRTALQVAAPSGWADALSALPWVTQGVARAATAHLETTYLSTRTMDAVIDFGLAQGAVAA